MVILKVYAYITFYEQLTCHSLMLSQWQAMCCLLEV